MTALTPEAVAASLTERARELLINAPCIGGKNPRGTVTWLCDHGLADCTIQGDHEAERWSMMLTPLGLQVRALLQADPRP